MLFGIELTDLIRTIGVIGVAIMVFAESGVLLGFFLPGDTLLFTAGFLTTKNILGTDINTLVIILTIAAVLGQSVGYWFGHKVGHRVFKRQDSILLHPDNLIRAQKFYDKYGAITIVLARFIPVVRTFVPIVAGAAKMNYRTFNLYNAIGAILWVALVTYLGYFAGAFFESQGIDIDHLILPIIGVVVLLTALSPLIHVIKDKQSRTKLLARLKFVKKAVK